MSGSIFSMKDLITFAMSVRLGHTENLCELVFEDPNRKKETLRCLDEGYSETSEPCRRREMAKVRTSEEDGSEKGRKFRCNDY